jgi:hypothetical protein
MKKNIIGDADHQSVMMEAPGTSAMSVKLHQSTQRNIPEDIFIGY